MTLDTTQQFEKIKDHVTLTDSKLGEMLVWKNDNIISYAIRLFGEYCDAEVEIMRLYLDSESVYVDIGTNIGYHARAIAQRTNCSVLAFEPHPSHFTVAAINTKDLPVQVINAAVGGEKSTLKISDFDFTQESNFGTVMISDTGSIDVPVITIDSVDLLNCTVMKIDTEGQELNVLKGADATIDKFRPVIFYEANDQEWIGAHKHLQAKNYRQYWVGVRTFPVNENFNKCTDNPFEDSGVTNILAVPIEKSQPDFLEEVRENETFNEMVKRMSKIRLLF